MHYTRTNCCQGRVEPLGNGKKQGHYKTVAKNFNILVMFIPCIVVFYLSYIYHILTLIKTTLFATSLKLNCMSESVFFTQTFVYTADTKNDVKMLGCQATLYNVLYLQHICVYRGIYIYLYLLKI